MPPAPSAPAPPRVGIVSTSLSAGSRSQRLAQEAHRRLTERGIDAVLLDLRSLPPLPPAGSDAGWSDPGVHDLKRQVTALTHLVFAVPIYNYDVNSVAKNFVELMGGDALDAKTVGFLCSAGGQGSYMSVMAFANSLMLDFRCWIVPRFLYVTQDFAAGQLDAELSRRLDGLLDDLLS